jgi:hypothetical protein
MGLHTSRHTRKNSSFSIQGEHLVLLGLEALTQPPTSVTRHALYYQFDKVSLYYPAYAIDVQKMN